MSKWSLAHQKGYRRKAGVAPIENLPSLTPSDVRGRSYECQKVAERALVKGRSSAPRAPRDLKPSFGESGGDAEPHF